MELHGGGTPTDWFFLAMAHWKNGDRDQARRWYDKAVDEMAKHPSSDPDLKRFRIEAELLLGIADAQMPTGPDAFARKEPRTGRGGPIIPIDATAIAVRPFPAIRFASSGFPRNSAPPTREFFASPAFWNPMRMGRVL